MQDTGASLFGLMMGLAGAIVFFVLTIQILDAVIGKRIQQDEGST